MNLDKATADALCTIIALGYLIKDDKCNIQYEKHADKSKHDAVLSEFNEISGKTFTCSQSRPQSDMPYIIARTGRVPNIESAKLLTDEYHKLLSAITRKANELGIDAPYGAYIGGLSAGDKLSLVGPSSLEQYEPRYRESVDTIKEAYDKAMNATNTALGCLEVAKNKSCHPKGITVTRKDMIAPVSKKFESGKLFKSYHGMIQAMVNYLISSDNNIFLFEIALGKNTTKVSSCLPCSIFMAANGKPATSTHLGRGDNWNIPQSDSPNGSYLTNNWKKYITDCYQEGCKCFDGKSNEKIGNTITFINRNDKKIIPNIFLEALTFESSFTDKIKSTLILDI